jgi:putative ubiquitin-RnfH superfamily antitoxin RatB of RatAB toxin-antitoxin module
VNVEVVYALPNEQFSVVVNLSEGATVADALNAVAGEPGFVDLDLSEAPVGIYGSVVGRERLLEEGERVEIYRRLAVDPRTARRMRANR